MYPITRAPSPTKTIAEFDPAISVAVIVDVPELPVATPTAVGEADTVRSEVADVCWVKPRKARLPWSELPLLASDNIVGFVPEIVICRETSQADHTEKRGDPFIVNST